MGRDTTGWRPPHCPNANCRYHKRIDPRWPYKRRGYYTRLQPPRCIQRYTCLACGRHFSVQTFSIDYWQKRPELIRPIVWLVVGCMANRQIARTLRCAPSTVAHQLTRLGRHALLFQAEELRRLPGLRAVVIDGFETFEWSQYFPFHHNVAVEAQSGYFLYHTDSPLRRKGRMTDTQKARRAELEARYGRPNPRAVEVGIAELLETLPGAPRPLTLRSDEHPAYPRAIRGLGRPVHHTVTSARVYRGRHNPLWEVNLLDLMIRHSTAAHKRETLAWAKRRQASAEKLSIFQVWKNYINKRWEKGEEVSAAMIAGLAHRRLRVRDIFRNRLFRTRIDLPPRWSLYYDRRVETPALGANRRHTLTYAY